jgi:hypothetical protein
MHKGYDIGGKALPDQIKTIYVLEKETLCEPNHSPAHPT